MPTIQLPELGKKYMEIVRNSNGLVSAAPSCVKALDKVGEGATEANLKAADQALEAQSKQVKAGLATGGEKAVKALKQFEKEIDALQADIKKIAKAVADISAALR
jgi:hypothetical protein